MQRTEHLQAFRNLDERELVQQIKDLEHELMNLRFRQASGQLEHSAQLGTLRKKISRAKTIFAQKKAEEKQEA